MCAHGTPSNPKLTYVDLFAGCGGLSLGLHQSGKWKGLFAVEKDPMAFETLRTNLISKRPHFQWPEWLPQCNHDIDVLLSEYESQLKSLRGTIDLVTGGPPCQGFSPAGRRKADDARNKLIRSYLRFIMHTRPRALMFENVKGFTQDFKTHRSKKQGYSYAAFVLRALNFFGYDVEGHLLDFSKFGVPQQRTRYILVGIRRDLKVKPANFFESLSGSTAAFLKAKGLPRKSTTGQAISDLHRSHGTMKFEGKGKFRRGIYASARTKYQKLMRAAPGLSAPDSHRFANHEPQVVARFKYLLRRAPRNKNAKGVLRDAHQTNKHTVIPLSAKLPSPTLTTLPDDYVHYAEPRILTVREYARIQTFPDDYIFCGKYTTGGPMRTKEVPRYSQVGNAIPPLFGEQAAHVLSRLVAHHG